MRQDIQCDKVGGACRTKMTRVTNGGGGGGGGKDLGSVKRGKGMGRVCVETLTSILLFSILSFAHSSHSPFSLFSQSSPIFTLDPPPPPPFLSLSPVPPSFAQWRIAAARQRRQVASARRRSAGATSVPLPTTECAARREARREALCEASSLYVPETEELISDIWGKRGASYGEKGVCRRIIKKRDLYVRARGPPQE